MLLFIFIACAKMLSLVYLQYEISSYVFREIINGLMILLTSTMSIDIKPISRKQKRRIAVKQENMQTILIIDNEELIGNM